MIKDDEHKMRIMEKFDFFYSEKCPVHIKKFTGEWLNGNLIDKRTDAIYIIDENVKGEVTIFVSEVKDINLLKSKEDGK